MVVLYRRRCELMKEFSISFPGLVSSSSYSSSSSSPGAPDPPPSSSSHSLSVSRSSNLACLVWALVAFLFGVMVGVTLPLLLTKYSVGGLESTGHLTSKGIDELHPKLGTIAAPPTQEPLNISAYYSSYPILLSSATAEGMGEEVNTVEKEFIVANSALGEEENGAILEDNVFFGSAVEASMPHGFSDRDVEEWREFVRQEAVVRLEEGCGRMQNRLLTFSNGSKSCCRYRQNLDQIQGEIFSFYLSRLLGMKNVPPSTLGVVKAGAWQWSGIGSQLALAQWAEERPVVLTKFVQGLRSVSIPEQLRSSSRRLHPLDIESIQQGSTSMATLVELAQWSDLVIFDYLTANLDRVVNNLYNLQWNPSMMDAPAHNLAQQKESNLLVFLDNESGLLHGYRLLDKYEPFHESLLQSLCVFRRSTADKIRRLVSKKEAGPKLVKMFRLFEPDLRDYLPSIPEKSIKVLNERLKRVHKQIKKCENIYMNS